MGYFVGLPLGGGTEKDCQVRFGKNMTFQVETCRMDFTERYTAYMASCEYRLGLYAGRGTAMFYCHCFRNSKAGVAANRNSGTGGSKKANLHDGQHG